MDRTTLRENIQSFCEMYEVSTRELLAALREEVGALPEDPPGDVALACQKIRRAERALDPTDDYPDVETTQDEKQPALDL